MAWQGMARCGKARAVFSGQRVTPLSGANRTTWPGLARRGLAWRGEARLGLAWQGRGCFQRPAGHTAVRCESHHVARQGPAGRGWAGLGKAGAVFSGQWVTPLSGANRTTRQGKAGHGSAGLGRARRGKGCFQRPAGYTAVRCESHLWRGTDGLGMAWPGRAWSFTNWHGLQSAHVVN